MQADRRELLQNSQRLPVLALRPTAQLMRQNFQIVTSMRSLRSWLHHTLLFACTC
ncbi:hypothetical protein BGY98DRAFT_1038445 [Russula aff. rugulosa BPL654]|nr:hypothetical protein BGY98DRAFT_1038445 [Russula aff. rugulosa BPL654]